MEPTRQIFALRRSVSLLGVVGLCALSACTTLEQIRDQIDQRLAEARTPSEPPAQSEPEPLPPEMPAPEASKPPMEMASRMPGKAPMMPKPRPRKPSEPNEQPVPKPAAPPKLVPADLIGSDFAEVLRLIRQPDMVQTSALAIVWTYTEPVCKLQLYFYPDIETTTFHVLKYDLRNAAGSEKLENAGTCMQRILVAKNDAASSP